MQWRQWPIDCAYRNLLLVAFSVLILSTLSQIDYDLKVKLKLVAITISPTISSSTTFDCPLPSVRIPPVCFPLPQLMGTFVSICRTNCKVS